MPEADSGLVSICITTSPKGRVAILDDQIPSQINQPPSTTSNSPVQSGKRRDKPANQS